MTAIAALQQYCTETAARAKQASRELAILPTHVKNAWLAASANTLRRDMADLVSANAMDIAAAPKFGLTAAQTDRLRLDNNRIEGIAAALEQVASLEDPVGELLETTTRPNGLEIQKRRVPLGVVFFIYESRPNLTADAAAICVKSGNAVILRGGKEAAHSSAAIVSKMKRCAAEHGLPEAAVQLVESPDRKALGHFLGLSEFIDLAIPRGGEGLIRRVTNDATMPVLKHFSGNCHVYVDDQVDLEMASKIVVNAKCQRMGVCNAAESLLVHRDIAHKFLPSVASQLSEYSVELRADESTREILNDAIPSTIDDLSTEYLGPIMSVNVVENIEQAIEHINQYGSGHTEAIVSSDAKSIEKFTSQVDSAAVMVNASTRFNDGGEFGLGAEIGISTDKLHARGPCGLKELTTYKYVVLGNGQIRE